MQRIYSLYLKLPELSCKASKEQGFMCVCVSVFHFFWVLWGAVVVVVMCWAFWVITRVTAWYNFLYTSIPKISLLSNMPCLTVSQESEL